MNAESKKVDPQIEHLLNELYELRVTLREITQKLSRVEGVVKRAFPGAIALREAAVKNDKGSIDDPPTFDREQALAYFDEVRDVVAKSDAEGGIGKLVELSIANLSFLAKELGVSVGKKKPSRRNLTNEILGRVRQSLLLRQHTPVNTPEGPRE